MSQPNQARLAELVCSVYREAGTPPLQTKKVKPREWHRPPLYTELTLLGEPLQPYLEVKLPDTDIDTLADVYEQFIAGYLTTRTFEQDPSKWLGDSLPLTYSDEDLLFAPPAGTPPGQRRHLMASLIQFAALVSYNFHSWKLDTPDSFVVTDSQSTFQFGVRDGTVVSNLRYTEAQLDLGLRMRGGGSLWAVPRSAGRRRRDLTIHDQIAAWAEGRPEVLLALQILWWRSRAPSAKRFMEMFEPEEEKPSIAEAVSQARVAMKSLSPLPELREIFVPAHMPIDEFIRRFASPYQKLKLPLSKEMHQKFERAIADLTQ